MDLSSWIVADKGEFRTDIPGDLEEALRQLDYLISNARELKLLHEATFISRTHDKLGIALRDKWKLWDSFSPLHRWFEENLEIFNADDITVILLVAWHRHISNKELDIVSLAKQKLEWWQKQEPILEHEAIEYISKTLNGMCAGRMLYAQCVKGIEKIFSIEIYTVDWLELSSVLYHTLSKITDLDNKSRIDSALQSLINDIELLNQ